jgi:hypothetical protein
LRLGVSASEYDGVAFFEAGEDFDVDTIRASGDDFGGFDRSLAVVLAEHADGGLRDANLDRDRWDD